MTPIILFQRFRRVTNKIGESGEEDEDVNNGT